MSGVRRVLMGVLAQAGPVDEGGGGGGGARTATLAPTDWVNYFPGGPGIPPWVEQQAFLVTVNNAVGAITEYLWSFEPVSATGGASMSIISGQGTTSATFQMQANSGGGGELSGTVVCRVQDESGYIFATAGVVLAFGNVL